MDSNLNIIRNNVDQLETRFEKLHEEMNSILNECNYYIKLAKNLCDQAMELTTILKHRLANASNEEKEWKDIKTKLATASIQGKVILNVGGDKYTTSVETLTREKNTFFTALFSQQWRLERDPNDESIFINRNGRIFSYILEYLRTNTMPPNVMQDETLLSSLFIEAEYFHLHSLMDKLGVIYFPDGTLLQLEHKKTLNEFYGKTNQRWKLIYKASHDGFDANAFHFCCNNKGPTMTIIQSSNNYLFGGYTSIPWTSNDSYADDSTTFLFTLINPHNIPPTKYFIRPDHTECAIRHHKNYGPTFGAGHDIYLANSSNSNNSSYTNFPTSYFDTTGMSDMTFTGTYNFSASDIEVYKLA
ncbi:unnamed protein product [Rotaria sp. Silwood1]|nr:unnamed protein product [Rotaria sp. Silwood1]CAF1429729.1 unnamed protein product [Rotaria sp. Silwood1]